MSFLSISTYIGSKNQKETQKPFFSKTTSSVQTFFQPKPATSAGKLTINQPGDKYEQEADAMAEQVVKSESIQRQSLPEEEEMLQSKPLSEAAIQRQCAECEKEGQLQRMSMPEEEELQAKPLMRATQNGATATPQFASQLSSTRGSGNSLSQDTLSSMNQAFGTDFSNVRIHTNSKAQEMSQGIQAKAFTHGSDIYFNRGQYNPGSTEGKRLLGHELTHVVQQNADLKGKGDVQMKSKIQKEDDECTPCSGIPPTDCAAYAANRSWLPDAYVFNATCACTETPNEPKANCIRKVLQGRLNATPASIKKMATRMKLIYKLGLIKLPEYTAFVAATLTPLIYTDHVVAYRTACCPSGPASYPAWIGVTTIPMPNCTSVWLAIKWGGGSCSGDFGSW